ncbi:MAG: BA14K family protein, partial [Mesorhizobium sp.]
MKVLSAVLGGFVLTLAVFASGLAFAVWILSAEPVRQAVPTSSVAELWPREPRKVDPASQKLERLPAREVPEVAVDQVSVDRTSKAADAASSAPDLNATASIKPAADEQHAVPAAHVE